MIFKSFVPAALLLAAAPALAQQQPATPGPEQALQQAAQAFGECVVNGVQAAPASATPEAASTAVLSGCSGQRQQLERVVNAMIDSLPEAQRAEAREQFNTQMGQAETQVAAAIRQHRAGPATPAEGR